MAARPRLLIKHNKIISIRFTQEQWSRVKSEAVKEKMKAAAWVRRQALSGL